MGGAELKEGNDYLKFGLSVTVDGLEDDKINIEGIDEYIIPDEEDDESDDEDPFAILLMTTALTSLLHGLIQVESGLALIWIQPRLSVYMVHSTSSY